MPYVCQVETLNYIVSTVAVMIVQIKNADLRGAGQVAHQPVIRHLEDGRIRICVDGNDLVRLVHSGPVLHRALDLREAGRCVLCAHRISPRTRGRRPGAASAIV